VRGTNSDTISAREFFHGRENVADAERTTPDCSAKVAGDLDVRTDWGRLVVH
jgi:hypothetical protein